MMNIVRISLLLVVGTSFSSDACGTVVLHSPAQKRAKYVSPVWSPALCRFLLAVGLRTLQDDSTFTKRQVVAMIYIIHPYM